MTENRDVFLKELAELRQRHGIVIDQRNLAEAKLAKATNALRFIRDTGDTKAAEYARATLAAITGETEQRRDRAMSDPDKPWRLPDAKPMTFDEMTARAQYEWQRAEDAEAEARALAAERDALAEKLERAVARLTAMRDDREGYRHTAHFRRGAAVELAQITGGKTDG